MFTDNFEFTIETFLGHALQLIIGVEFVKMVAKHTTESALDVLVFAVARKMIIEHGNTMLDLLIGSVAIAVLFLLKKYFSNLLLYQNNKSIIYNGATQVHAVNEQMGIHIPENLGNTLAGILANHLNHMSQKPKAGYRLFLEDAELEIYSMDEDLIKQIRVITKSNKKGILHFFDND